MLINVSPSPLISYITGDTLLHADLVAKYGKPDVERAYFKEMNLVADSLWNLKELEASEPTGLGMCDSLQLHQSEQFIEPFKS